MYVNIQEFVGLHIEKYEFFTLLHLPPHILCNGENTQESNLFTIFKLSTLALSL